MAAAPRFTDKQTEDRHHDAEEPRDEIPTVHARQPARPHVAVAHDHAGADLDEHRPARRQPGAVRADGRHAQDADVQDAGGDRLQGDRGRVPVRVRNRLQLRPRTDRGRPHSRRRDDRSADAGARRPDRAHLRVAARREARDRAPVQRDRAGIPQDRVQPRSRRREAAGGERGAHDQAMRRCGDRHAIHAAVQPGNVYRDRTRFREGSLRRGVRRVAADARAQVDREPAGHGGNRHAELLCGPDRVDAPQPRASRFADPVGAPAQRPRYRGRGGRARGDGRRLTRPATTSPASISRSRRTRASSRTAASPIRRKCPKAPAACRSRSSRRSTSAAASRS